MFPMAARRCLATLGTRALRGPQGGRCLQAGPAQWPLQRGFASAAAGKVSKTLDAEIKHETEQYEQAKEIKAFLEKKKDFKLVEQQGDVNVALERAVGDKQVRIEWQLTSPFSPDGEGEGEEPEQEATEFMVTIENKTSGAGLSFYCSTVTGDDHRYVIGSVKAFASAEERDSASGYNGPDFEDIDEKLQEAFDEYLAEMGMDSEVCDLIDAMAQDKEQREYVNWLKVAKKFLES